MGAAYFYHLTQRSLEATLPVLLEKALAAGWRVAVRGTDAARLSALDDHLWHFAADSFLPHGLAGGAQDADQPILLTTEAAAANRPNCVMAVDGATLEAAEVRALSRACVLFDGTDPAAVQAARVMWKSLTDAGCSAQYWSEDSGRWEKKAEK